MDNGQMSWLFVLLCSFDGECRFSSIPMQTLQFTRRERSFESRSTQNQLALIPVKDMCLRQQDDPPPRNESNNEPTDSDRGETKTTNNDDQICGVIPMIRRMNQVTSGTQETDDVIQLKGESSAENRHNSSMLLYRTQQVDQSIQRCYGNQKASKLFHHMRQLDSLIYIQCPSSKTLRAFYSEICGLGCLVWDCLQTRLEYV